MGASESTAVQEEEQPVVSEVSEVRTTYVTDEGEERGFYGQRISTVAPPPPPESTYNVLVNNLRAIVPEEHVNRLIIYMLIFGALIAIIGVVGLVSPFFFAIAVEQVIGSLLVIGGIFSLLQYGIMFYVPGNSSFLLLGFLHLGIGLWMLLQPIEAGIMLTFVISGWLLAHGILKSLMACQVRNLSSSPFIFVSGTLSVLLAFVILVLTPHYGVVLLGIIFGADFLVSGLSMILIATTTYFSPRKLNCSREPLLEGA